jgi:hypothetical protein
VLNTKRNNMKVSLAGWLVGRRVVNGIRCRLHDREHGKENRLLNLLSLSLNFQVKSSLLDRFADIIVAISNPYRNAFPCLYVCICPL